MQKFLSFLIVFIISVFPIVNASASLPTCEDIMSETMSMSQLMSTEAMTSATDADNTSTMTEMDDCCEIHKVTCDHVTACDCDNPQVNYSAVPSLPIAPLQHLGSFKSRYISSLFHSKSSDSLYRPPINTLI